MINMAARGGHWTKGKGGGFVKGAGGRMNVGRGDSIPRTVADVRPGDFIWGARGQGSSGYVVSRGVLGRGNDTEVFRVRNPFHGDQFIPVSEARIGGLG